MQLKDEALGRYAPAGGDPGDLVPVDLLAAPVRLWHAATEHHDEVLREMSLLAMSPSPRWSPRLRELVQQLGERYAAATERPDDRISTALQQGLDRADLHFELPRAAGPAATAMKDLLDEAESLCRDSGELLTLPRTELLNGFAEWYVEQIVVQCAGGPATPWRGPWDLRG